MPDHNGTPASTPDGTPADLSDDEATDLVRRLSAKLGLVDDTDLTADPDSTGDTPAEPLAAEFAALPDCPQCRGSGKHIPAGWPGTHPAEVVDRAKLAHRFNLVNADLIGIRFQVNTWAGRGNWSQWSQKFRDAKGLEALASLDAWIGQLVAFRADLATAIDSPDGAPDHEPEVPS